MDNETSFPHLEVGHVHIVHCPQWFSLMCSFKDLCYPYILDLLQLETITSAIAFNMYHSIKIRMEEAHCVTIARNAKPGWVCGWLSGVRRQDEGIIWAQVRTDDTQLIKQLKLSIFMSTAQSILVGVPTSNHTFMTIMQWSSPILMRCNSQRNFIYGSIIHNDWETLSAVSYLMKLHNQNQCIAITCQLFSIISYVNVKWVSVWFWLRTSRRWNIELEPNRAI